MKSDIGFLPFTSVVPTSTSLSQSDLSLSIIGSSLNKIHYISNPGFSSQVIAKYFSTDFIWPAVATELKAPLRIQKGKHPFLNKTVLFSLESRL